MSSLPRPQARALTPDETPSGRLTPDASSGCCHSVAVPRLASHMPCDVYEADDVSRCQGDWDAVLQDARSQGQGHRQQGELTKGVCLGRQSLVSVTAWCCHV